ncbi:MAG: colanic acid biosynthesis acetyltransferase WcaF, partial [Merismopedia sp. SIO2A8]|nr:colanic acid biosynthesis acetyltransferase WcaF [Merismopedia sp. SIO2A8]
FIKQLLWYYIGSPLVQSYWLPWSSLKCQILRGFGANIGRGTRIKPGVRIKFPWRLTIGDHSWIGEKTWIDNLAPVVIADNVCVSQNVYFCTGNHHWDQPTFDLRLGMIWVESGSWLAAKSVIGPGVIVGTGAILTLGSVATRSLQPMGIYTGNPAQWTKKRVIKEAPHASN